MMVVQIVMNNVLTKYGADTIYGADIPLAVSGILMKISMIIFSFIVGITMGCQPIQGFNYGAKKYGRVKATYRQALIAILAFSIVAFSLLQIFPREIVGIFGSGDDLYFEFAERFTRIFLMMFGIFGIQTLTVSFFTAIGKAKQSVFLTLTRQGLFLLPLLIILPMFLGIDGALIAGPIADFSAVALCAVLAAVEMRRITALQREHS